MDALLYLKLIDYLGGIESITCTRSNKVVIDYVYDELGKIFSQDLASQSLVVHPGPERARAILIFIFCTPLPAHLLSISSETMFNNIKIVILNVLEGVFQTNLKISQIDEAWIDVYFSPAVINYFKCPFEKVQINEVEGGGSLFLDPVARASFQLDYNRSLQLALRIGGNSMQLDGQNQPDVDVVALALRSLEEKGLSKHSANLVLMVLMQGNTSTDYAFYGHTRLKAGQFFISVFGMNLPNTQYVICSPIGEEHGSFLGQFPSLQIEVKTDISSGSQQVVLTDVTDLSIPDAQGLPGICKSYPSMSLKTVWVLTMLPGDLGVKISCYFEVYCYSLKERKILSNLKLLRKKLQVAGLDVKATQEKGGGKFINIIGASIESPVVMQITSVSVAAAQINFALSEATSAVSEYNGGRYSSPVHQQVATAAVRGSGGVSPVAEFHSPPCYGHVTPAKDRQERQLRNSAERAIQNYPAALGSATLLRSSWHHSPGVFTGAAGLQTRASTGKINRKRQETLKTNLTPGAKVSRLSTGGRSNSTLFKASSNLPTASDSLLLTQGSSEVEPKNNGQLPAAAEEPQSPISSRISTNMQSSGLTPAVNAVSLRSIEHEKAPTKRAIKFK